MQKYKIALIYPGVGSQMPSLGLGYIAAYLRKYLPDKVEDIRIFDENAGENVFKLSSSFEPDIVGITATTPYVGRALTIAKTVKQIVPNGLIALGGAHVTAIPEIVKNKDIDLGILGEGEKTFFEIVDQFEDVQKLESDILHDIKGIAYKDDKGNVIKTEKRPFIEDLSEIPFPARDLMRMKQYYCRPKESIRDIIAKTTIVMGTRGCPYDCYFCSNDLLWKRKVRYFKPERVVAEIEHLVKEYKIEGLCFADDTFTINKKWLGDVCERIIAKGLEKEIFWECQERVNTVSTEKLALMKKAGAIRVGFGFESGSDRILKTINKNVTVDQTLRAIDLTSKSGLMVMGNFMIGIPGETKEDMEMTRKLYLNPKLDQISLFAFTPFPGTKFYNDLQDKHKLVNISNWDNFAMGLRENNIIVNDKVDPDEFRVILERMRKEADEINLKKKVYLYKRKNLSDTLFLFQRKLIIFLWHSRPDWAINVINKSPFLSQIKSKIIAKIRTMI